MRKLIGRFIGRIHSALPFNVRLLADIESRLRTGYSLAEADALNQ